MRHEVVRDFVIWIERQNIHSLSVITSNASNVSVTASNLDPAPALSEICGVGCGGGSHPKLSNMLGTQKKRQPGKGWRYGTYVASD
jgi:hypothetical protein